MKMTKSIRFRGTPLVQFGIVVFCFRKSGFWNMRFGEAAKGIPFLVCRVGSRTHKRALTTSAVSNSFFFLGYKRFYSILVRAISNLSMRYLSSID